MTAIELVNGLRAKGVELVPAGDRLRFRPGEAVSPEEREALRRCKAEVLRLLAGDPLVPVAPVSLDPVTVRELLGPRPDPATVAVLEAEVSGAVYQLEAEIASGILAPGVSTVRGRPLADLLDLGDLARILSRPGPPVAPAGAGAVALWPPAVPDLGPRGVQAFDRCACGTGTWVAYGPRPLCLLCARRRTEPAP